MRLFFLILLLFELQLVAQNKKMEIKGRVTDASSKKGIEYATLSLLSALDSSFIAGTATDSTGHFIITTEYNKGRLLLRTDFIGYKRLFMPLEIGEKDLYLGEILLKENSTALGEIIVEGEKDFVQHSIEKQVYSVDKLGTTRGGNAADVLQNIPSVTIDQEGTPSLRGTNVIVLIDGRPSGLSGQGRSAVLDQIPASSIDRIEVVSNPSARYDADGMSGIINVVLKKDAKPGYNGNVAMTIGDRDKYNAALQFNYRKGALNWYANYTYNYGRYYGTGSSYRTTFYPDTLYYILQQQNNDNISVVNMFKTGIDYQFNPKSSITTAITINTRSNKLPNEVFDNTRLDAGLNLRSAFARTMERDIETRGLEWATNYTHNLSKKGSFISTDAIVSFGKETIDRVIGQDASNSLRAQQTDGDTAYLSSMPELGTNSLITFNTDFSRPLSEQSRVEAGAKASFRNIDRDFMVNDFDFSVQQYIKNKLQSNRFVYSEQLISVYGIYGGRKGKWNYQGGARIEQAYTLADQKTLDLKYSNQYFNIFPSAHIGYKWKSTSDWKITYSRRIVRPDIQSLNPFINYADRFNLRRGNPMLQPEYVNSYEFGHLLTLKRITLSSTIYHRQSTHFISRYRSILPQGLTVVEFQNIAGSETIGFELVNTWQIQKWWSLNTSGNIFRRQIFTGDRPTTQANQLNSWNLKALSTFKLYGGTDFTLSYTYDSPVASPQGKILSYQGLDVSLKKDFFKKKWTIGMRFSDVFNTRRFRMEMATPQFTDYMTRKRESRNVFVTVTWRFGSEDAALKRQDRKKGGINTEGSVEDGL